MLFQNITGQEKPLKWNNHACAVVLTYDDGLNTHLDKVIPLLDSMGFRGTFFVNGNAATIPGRINDWRMAAGRGHELGNHTLFHPCAGTGRSWVNPDYDLDHYSLNRTLDELKLANALLYAIDGNNKRSFAYTCGNMAAGTDSFNRLIGNQFIAARSVTARYEDLDSVDLYDIGSFMENGATGSQMIAQVKEAMKQQKLMVFLFHGVGGEHSLNVSLEAHRELLEFLKAHSNEIWVTTFTSAAEYIKSSGK